MKAKYVLGIDPSGNFEEGKGTTGLCLIDLKTNKPVWSGFVQAKLYDSQIHYWEGVIMMFDLLRSRYNGIVFSMESYLLYQHAAMTQVNSEFETPQLIGVIKYYCFKNRIQLYMRPASRVKKRWNEDILVRKGYLKHSKRIGYYIEHDDEITQMVDHQRDALKHAVHCALFELKENNNDR